MYDFDYFVNKRNKIMKFYMLPAGIVAGIGLIMFFMAFSGMGGSPAQIFPFFVLGFILFAIGGAQMNKLSTEFKQKYLVAVLEKNFTKVAYNPNGGLSRSDVKRSELLPSNTDRFYSNDLIRGEFQDVDFKFCDLKLQEVHGSGKDRKVVTVFQGPFMEFDFNKDFDGKVQVREKMKSTFFNEYDKVNMESVEFNKVFRVYATKSHAAFYILTPHLMEKLMELERQRPGYFYFSFIEGRMYIALDNRRDNFEIGMFGKIDQSIIDTFERQLSIIKDIVTEMKLNENF